MCIEFGTGLGAFGEEGLQGSLTGSCLVGISEFVGFARKFGRIPLVF